jgi:transcriptional regulator with XRE-family HTH domain
MSKLKVIRKELGLKQAEFATKLGTNTMIVSLMENDEVLPVPVMLKQIENVTGAKRLFIYEKEELQLVPKNTRFSVPADYPFYHLHVKLPRAYKTLLSQDNLKAKGFTDINHWIVNQLREFAKDLGYIDQYFKTTQENKRKGTKNK